MQDQHSFLNGTHTDEASSDPYAYSSAAAGQHILRCSFCGLGEGEVARLFEGHSGYICDECVDVCVQLLDEYQEMGVRTPAIKQPWYKKLLGGDPNNANNCSFNHHDRQNPQGGRLFPGNDAQICDKCVRACEVLKSGLIFG
jgi:hypothetical protein